MKRRHAREAFEEYADRKSGLQERARTQRAWMDAGSAKAARPPKDNDKIGRNLRIEQTEKQAAKARQTDRMIERLPEVAEPRKEWELQYSIQAAPRSGSVVAVARGATAAAGRISPWARSTCRSTSADRIGVTGPNGGGKSTLLALLLGRIEPAGGAVSLGSGVAVGEVDQARGQLLGPATLLRTFADLVPDWPEAEVRTLLAKFGLRAEHVLRPAISLSPGERTRAAMALLQARGVNLLVLDEPTNHLDLPAIEQLEVALEAYTGTLLLVTHDRRMLRGGAADQAVERRRRRRHRALKRRLTSPAVLAIPFRACRVGNCCWWGAARSISCASPVRSVRASCAPADPPLRVP